MAMDIFSDTPNNGPITFAIHLDNTKRNADSTPDEHWVEWYRFPEVDMSTKPANLTAAQWRNQYAAQCREEARGGCALALRHGPAAPCLS